MKIAVLGMRMRNHHPHYHRNSPIIPRIQEWQRVQIDHYLAQGAEFLFPCADHFDSWALKHVVNNGRATQARLFLPYPGFGEKQGADWRRPRQILEHMGRAEYSYSEEPSDAQMRDALNRRNIQMIREADVVLWLWDGVQNDAYDRIVLNKPVIAFPWKQEVARLEATQKGVLHHA